MPTLAAQREELLAAIAGMIREVIDEDWVQDAPIGMETSFEADLELESIELVALGERLREHYGDDFDLAGWLSSMELDEIIALRVGDLVEFMAASR
jgi:acyl carrier protein